MMRRISDILACAALLAALAGCSKLAEGTLYRPNSDDGKEIHFSVSSMEKTFAEGEKAGVIELTLVRPGTSGTHEILLSQMSNDSEVFSFPESVTIQDGKYSAIVPVLVDLSQCAKGSAYSTNIYIVGRDQATGNYGVKNALYSDAVKVTAQIALQWEPLMVQDEATGQTRQQTATFTYNAFWNGTSENLPVEVAVSDDIIYRVSGWGTSETYFMWSVKEDRTCVVPKQNTGYFNSTYSQYIMVSDYPSNGTNAGYTYSSYPCTWDGERTFTFNLIYYREGSTGNFGKGVETLVFDSAKDRSPAVSLAYEGVDSLATGFVGARLSFTPNAYARKYDVIFYEGSGADLVQTDSLTFYDASTETWNLSEGPHTLRAVAYNEEGEPGDPSELVFTFDPQKKYCVNVREFLFECDESNESYDPTTSLHYRIKTDHLTRGWYLTAKESYWTSNLKKMSLEDLVVANGTVMSDAFISSANSTKGRSSYYTTLTPGTTYRIAMVLENQYGERVVVWEEAATASKSSRSGIDDFDKSAVLGDFLGSYLMSAGVGSSLTSTVDMVYRVDINRMDDNRVVISGLGSPVAGFDPQAVAYFDATRHCLVLDPQYVCQHGENFAQLAMYTGTSYVYATGAFLLGIVDGEVVWISSPDYPSYTFVGYTFMLFNSLPANSASYTKSIVDSKVFVNPAMTRLESAVAAE